MTYLESAATVSECGNYRYDPTSDGHPRHPLYLKGDVRPVPFKEATRP